jgi:arylsulfatase A-like enzyme
VNAICLVIDRLHSGFLGALGNTWIETPAFDRLAAESFIFDQMLVDSPQLGPLYRSFWQGLHALAPAVGSPNSINEGRPTLPGLLREAGVQCTLMSDETAVISHPLAIEFDSCIQIDPPWQSQTAAEGAYEETHLARCFLQIMEWVQTAKRPFFLWCHLGSLGTTWDAPLECRERYWDESDPPLLTSADVPDRMLKPGFDPDELLVYTQAYAGQIALLDTCLGGFLEVLDANPKKGGWPLAHKTMLALTASRGLPMGEHLRLGPCDEALHGELVHVPLVLRFPDRLGAAARSQALVEPADLWATLLDRWRPRASSQQPWPAVPPSPTGVSLMPLVREEPAATRERLVVAGVGQERAIRTPAWYLRKAEPPELYAKPDDVWEVNDVANRCQDVVECLLDAADQYEQAIYSGTLDTLPPLSDVLVEGLG